MPRPASPTGTNSAWGRRWGSAPKSCTPGVPWASRNSRARSSSSWATGRCETPDPDRSGSERAMRLGIMGGTFDPIHLGHLRAAEEIYWAFGLDRIIFVPAARPPHKDEDVVASALHRYEMVSLATVFTD